MGWTTDSRSRSGSVEAVAVGSSGSANSDIDQASCGCENTHQARRVTDLGGEYSGHSDSINR